MKRNLSKHKIQKLAKDLIDSVALISNYINNQDENLDEMSDLSLRVFNLIESPNHLNKIMNPIDSRKFINHIRSEKFKKFPCLILQKENQYFFYTQFDVLMFFRGINHHGVEQKDKKKKILEEFLHNSRDVDMIFLIGCSFIETPIVKYSPVKTDLINTASKNENENGIGVLDSGYSPFVQKLANKEFTKIESCWFKIVHDLLGAKPLKPIYIGIDWFKVKDFGLDEKQIELLEKMNKTITKRK